MVSYAICGEYLLLKIIRVLHGCEGADRKNPSEGHCLVSRGFAE